MFLRPSVHEIWILWLFCHVWAISGLFLANRPWPKIWHLFFLTLLESYNQFLKRKWIYMQVHTGGDSAPTVHAELKGALSRFQFIFIQSLVKISTCVKFHFQTTFWFSESCQVKVLMVFVYHLSVEWMSLCLQFFAATTVNDLFDNPVLFQNVKKNSYWYHDDKWSADAIKIK